MIEQRSSAVLRVRRLCRFKRVFRFPRGIFCPGSSGSTVFEQQPPRFDHLLAVGFQLFSGQPRRRIPIVFPAIHGCKAYPQLPCQLFLAQVQLVADLLDQYRCFVSFCFHEAPLDPLDPRQSGTGLNIISIIILASSWRKIFYRGFRGRNFSNRWLFAFPGLTSGPFFRCSFRVHHGSGSSGSMAME